MGPNSHLMPRMRSLPDLAPSLQGKRPRSCEHILGTAPLRQLVPFLWRRLGPIVHGSTRLPYATKQISKDPQHCYAKHTAANQIDILRSLVCCGVLLSTFIQTAAR